MIRIIWLLAAFVALAQAQDQTPASGAVLQGKVFASDTNGGIAGASVELRSQPFGAMLQMRTDANGAFTFTGVPPGEYLVTARRIGYGQVNYSVTTPAGRQATLRLKLGDVQNVAMRLMPLGTVEGAVYGPDGAPMAGARVMLSHHYGVSGKRVLMPEREITTGPDGTFQVTAVPSGEYFVSAFYRGSRGAVDGVSAPVYYPGTASIRNAQKVGVVLGRATKDIKVQLGAPVDAGKVRGGTVDRTGTPLAGASVIVRRETEDGIWSLLSADSVAVKTGATGEFAVGGLLAGNYRLLVSGTVNGRKLVAHTAFASNAQGTTDVTLVAEPHATVSGRIVIEGSKEKLDPRVARVVVRSEANAGSPGMGSAVVAKDGTFQVENVFEGPARIEVSTLRQAFYVKSIRRHGQELSDHSLNINKGEQVDGIEAVISFSPAQLTGTISSGNVVVLFPADARLRRERPDLTKIAAVGPGGQYLLRGIAPGEYRIAGLRNAAKGVEADEAALGSLESQAASVVLAAGAQGTFDLQAVEAPRQ